MAKSSEYMRRYRASKAGNASSASAEENNRRMAGDAMNALRDMHTDAYRLLGSDRDVSNARDAIEDVMWYSRTGRADIDFEGGIGALTPEQQKTFIRGLAEKSRSRDDNVKKAKQLLKKIKPNAGSKAEPKKRTQTEEQRRISETVNREYQADRTAERVRRRYGR